MTLAGSPGRISSAPRISPYARPPQYGATAPRYEAPQYGGARYYGGRYYTNQHFTHSHSALYERRQFNATTFSARR
jgi:hypothetical protein